MSEYEYDAGHNLIKTPKAELRPDGTCSACGRQVGKALPTHRCGEPKIEGTAAQAARDCNFTA